MNVEMDISKNQWRSTGGKTFRESAEPNIIFLNVSKINHDFSLES